MNVFVTDVGYGALVIGLLIAFYTAVAAASGAMKGYPELLRSARNGVLVTFGLTSLALVYVILRAWLHHRRRVVQEVLPRFQADLNVYDDRIEREIELYG